MKISNKKAVETKVVAELILGLVLTVILIALIYSSFKGDDVIDDGCLQSLVLAKKLGDLSVINCPYHTVNISSKELANAILSKEIASCWFKFGQGEIILSDNSKDKIVFCYVCSLVEYSDKESYTLTKDDVSKFLENLFIESNGVSVSFDKNNLKMDEIKLSKGDMLYVYFAIDKTGDDDFIPYMGVTKENILDKCKVETNSLR